ncbi:MAG TPA: DUF1761 domain-containing protein [Chitinophagales bacterium]|nr:DUF1761 domain-containing protein [Chitinophagales bacterium]
MHFNMLITSALAALIPLFVGMVWYHPKVFGTAWMSVNGFSEDKMKEGFNMPLVFGLTFVFGFFIAFGLSAIVIHQFGFFGMLQHQVADVKDAAALDFFAKGFENYGNEFRTFKHGTLHGTIAGITLALPIVAINALFERRGFKYIAIHAGYWIVCLCLMGGFICQFADVTAEMFK